MAFPVVETTAESSTNTAGTSHVVTLPSGIAAGDLILILADKGSTAATFNTHADYTELVDENLGNGITIWARDATGGESNPTFTSSASTRSACIAYRISGAQPITVQAPELSTVATGTSANPNATTCTPTGGAKDYLWITMFGQAGEQADDDSLTTVTPTGFTNPIEKTCGTAGTNLGGMIASAEQQLNAASVDASAWTSSDTTAWRAYTIAVHPKPPTQSVTPAAVTVDATPGTVTVEVGDAPTFTVTTRTSQNGTNSTSQVVTLPDGSNVSGRLVVVVAGVDGTGGVAWPSGWTEIHDSTTTATELAVGYRIIDGSEGFDGTDDTITLTTASEQSNTHAYLIQGAHASQAPEAATAATGTNGPDPPSLNPAGWDTEETLWIAAAVNRFATIQTAPPTNYTNLLAQNGGDDNAPLCTAQRVLSSASEDPGAFTGGDTDWVATTIAVRPAGAGAQPITPAAVTVNITAGTLTVTAGPVDVTPAPVTVAATAGTATLTIDIPLTGPTVAATPGAPSLTIDIPLTGPTVTATAGTLTVSASGGAQSVTPAATTVTATAGTLTVSPGPVNVTPAPVTVDVTAGTLTVAAGVASITPAPVTVNATTGTLTVTQGLTVVADPPTVTATPGTLTITTGPVGIAPTAPTVTATPGTLGVTIDIPLVDPSVTATAGTLTVTTGAASITPAPVTVTATAGTLTVFLGGIPFPAGKPLAVPAGSHAVTVEKSGHKLTVPAGTNVVEVP